MKAAALTAVGLVREHNEDMVYCTIDPIGLLPNLFIVADGMGGHNAGEVASQKSVESFCDYIKGLPSCDSQKHTAILDNLTAATLHANRSVFALSISNMAYMGMGTTFSACCVAGSWLILSHVGDSRIYTVCPQGITQISTDHTYVNELIQAGSITPQEARVHPKRNQLTNVVGCSPEIETDGVLHDISNATSVLLCSDGLTDMLTDEDIFEIITSSGTPQMRGQSLIDAANANGGVDNISVIIIDL